MSEKYSKKRSFLNQGLISSIVVSSLISPLTSASELYFGANDDIILQINSELSVGASWRLNDPSAKFIGSLNGGTGATTTTDDGNLNFKKHDTFSKIIKGNHSFQLSNDTFGAFMRVKYWYDKELDDEKRYHGHSSNGYVPNTRLNDTDFSDFSKFKGIELLDAYLYAQFDIGSMPVDLRLGRQVVSWGESTFIQGGISSVNPFDVSAFRRPGAQLKEGLLPVGMFYLSLGLTENLSLETFYQYEWEKTQIDGCGTYFSGADFAADGCNAVTVKAPDQQALAVGLAAVRRADVEPDDGGQYGVALRYYAPALNDTEFGLYYLNIHSRVPMINAVRTGIPGLLGPTAPIFVPRYLDTSPNKVLSGLNPAYQIEFPEDLKYYGISFATNIDGLALSGEVSYKPDTPIQINGAEILNAVLSESPIFRFTPRLKSVEYGAVAKGYDEFDVTQIQITALQFFDRVMGASRLTVIGEAAVILTDGIGKSKQRYGRNSLFGIADFDLGNNINCTNLVAAKKLGSDCRSDGFVTNSAWGYVMRAIWEYDDVYAGISLKPTLSWKHDVKGYSPAPGQQFHQGSKTLGLSVQASYQQKYSATIGYTSYSGGSHNVLADKDFVSLSFDISY